MAIHDLPATSPTPKLHKAHGHKSPNWTPGGIEHHGHKVPIKPKMEADGLQLSGKGHGAKHDLKHDKKLSKHDIKDLDKQFDHAYNQRDGSKVPMGGGGSG